MSMGKRGGNNRERETIYSTFWEDEIPLHRQSQRWVLDISMRGVTVVR
jgi:hypothetical protein